jgi:hypothetical protein
VITAKTVYLMEFEVEYTILYLHYAERVPVPYRPISPASGIWIYCISVLSRFEPGNTNKITGREENFK